MTAGRSPLARFRRTPLGGLAKRVLDRVRLTRIRRSLTPVHGSRELPLAPDELIVLSLVKDGELHVKSFVEHHLRLGARWILLVDNGSSDRTVEIARRYPEVAIWRLGVPIRPYEWLARRHLVRRLATDRWSLTADIDERFDYPFSQQLPLRGFLAYLESRGFTAVVTYLLERFAVGPVGARVTTPDDDPADFFPYYDVSAVERAPYHRYSLPAWGNEPSDPGIAWYRGGIRRSALGCDVSLTKQALVYCGRGTDPHPANHVRRAKIADVTAVLHHYRFLCDFRESLERTVRDDVFPGESVEYAKMLDALRVEPELSLYSESAREIASTDDLLDVGFLRASDAYRSWVARWSSDSREGA